jgi:hypothetical protein
MCSWHLSPTASKSRAVAKGVKEANIKLWICIAGLLYLAAATVPSALESPVVGGFLKRLLG